jgi:hypothetical protein
MPIGDVNPSSFAPYEGIRILVPGAVAVTLYVGVTSTYGIATASPTSNAFGAVVAALFVGLFLRFVDAPARCASYRTDRLPDRELRRWGVTAGEYGRFPSLYFVMLDTSFPPTIRDRALYTGSMFRIAFESIYMVGLASLGVLTLAATRPSLGTTRGGTTATRSILIATAVLQLAMVIAAAGSRYRFRRNRMDRKHALRAIAAEVQGDLKLSGLIGLLIAAYAIGPAVDGPSSIATCLAVSAPALLWATLYFTGRSDGRENARSLSPPASVLLFGAAAALACLTAAIDPHGISSS